MQDMKSLAEQKLSPHIMAWHHAQPHHMVRFDKLSKEVSKSNFRQYGQMKSRAGKRQREEKA